MSLDENRANSFTLIYIRTDQKDDTINYYKKV